MTVAQPRSDSAEPLVLIHGFTATARSLVALSPAGGWEAGSREQEGLGRFFRRTRRALRFAGPRARFRGSIDVPVRVAWGPGDRILTYPRHTASRAAVAAA